MDQFQLIYESVCVSGSDSASEEPTSCGCKLQHGETKTCYDHRCINFATQNECIDCSSTCFNRRLQDRVFKKLEAREIYPKGHGLFALEDIQPGDLVTEYLGDIVSQTDLEKRLTVMADRKEHHMYVMQLKPKVFVDSRYRGSIARFYNHSCSPNCKLEVWSVNGCLRLAIFATQSISSNEELTIDYSWKLSGRPPTRCYCKSDNCRGFLEIFNQEDIDEVLSRKGTWISCREREVLSSNHYTTSTSFSSIFDENRKLIPSKILHKYVKMWYEDTQSFVETRVEESFGNGVFLLLDIFRKDTFEENLDSPDANWLWLDESQPEIIRKRLETDMDEDDEDDFCEVKSRLLNTSSSSRISNNNNDDTSSSHTRPPQSLKNATSNSTIARCLKIKFTIAFYILYHRLLTRNESNDASLRRKLIDDFAYYCHITYPGAVRTKLIVDTNSNQEKRKSFDLEIISEILILKQINNLLIATQDEVSVKEHERRVLEQQSLLNTQGVSLLHIDWRVLPILPPSSQANSTLLTLSHIIAKSNYSETVNRHLLPTELLPMIFYGPKLELPGHEENDDYSLIVGHKLYTVTKTVEMTLKCHLENSILKAKLPEIIIFPSLVLLTRYLMCIEETNIIRDTVIILSSIIMVTLKSRHLFRLRYFKKIIKAVYMIVFNRQENDVTSASTESYIPRIIEKEVDIVNRLQHDLYVPNMLPIISSTISTVKQEEMQSIWNNKTLKILSFLYLHASVYFLSFQLETFQFVVFLLTLLDHRAVDVENMIQEQCQAGDVSKDHIMAMIILVMEVMESNADILTDHVSWLGKSDEFEGDVHSDKMDVDDDDDDGGEHENVSARMSKAQLIETLTVALEVQSLPSIASLLSPKQFKDSSSSHVDYWLQPAHQDRKRKYRLHPITSTFISSTNNSVIEVSNDKCTSLGKDMCLVIEQHPQDSTPSIGFIRSLPLARTAKRETAKAQSQGINKWPQTIDEIHELHLLRLLFGHAAFLQPESIVHITTPTAASDNATDDNNNGSSSLVKRKRNEGSEHDQAHSSGGKTERKSERGGVSFTRGLLVSAVTSFVHVSYRQLCLNFSSSSSSSSSIYIVPPCLAVDWCRQLLQAAEFMHQRGMVIKWLDPDYLCFTSCGQLVITSLNGVVVAEDELHQMIKPMPPTATTSGSKKSKHNAEDRDKDNNSSDIPADYLHLVAPELIFGGVCSASSSLYTIGMVCIMLLTGRVLIKNGHTEEKQVEYLYKVLGTPKAAGYDNVFQTLPLASKFGSLIQKEDGKMVDNKPRVLKTFSPLCPPALLVQYSSNSSVRQSQPAAVVVTKTNEEEGDHGGVLDVIKALVHLVPDKRKSINEVLSLAIFASPPSSQLQQALSNEGITMQRIAASPVIYGLQDRDRLKLTRKVVSDLRQRTNDTRSSTLDNRLFSLQEERLRFRNGTATVAPVSQAYKPAPPAIKPPMPPNNMIKAAPATPPPPPKPQEQAPPPPPPPTSSLFELHSPPPPPPPTLSLPAVVPVEVVEELLAQAEKQVEKKPKLLKALPVLTDDSYKADGRTADDYHRKGDRVNGSRPSDHRRSYSRDLRNSDYSTERDSRREYSRSRSRDRGRDSFDRYDYRYDEKDRKYNADPYSRDRSSYAYDDYNKVDDRHRDHSRDDGDKPRKAKHEKEDNHDKKDKHDKKEHKDKDEDKAKKEHKKEKDKESKQIHDRSRSRSRERSKSHSLNALSSNH